MKNFKKFWNKRPYFARRNQERDSRKSTRPFRHCLRNMSPRIFPAICCSSWQRTANSTSLGDRAGSQVLEGTCTSPMLLWCGRVGQRPRQPESRPNLTFVWTRLPTAHRTAAHAPWSSGCWVRKNFQDFPSHRIFGRMHGALNIDKNKN